MSFVIKDTLIEEWPKLRALYIKQAKTTPQPQHQNTAIERFFGGKNSKDRHFQLEFTEKIFQVLRSRLKPDLKFKDAQAFDEHMSACKILIVTAFYIKHQIGLPYWMRSPSNSDLYEILDNTIGLVGKNQLNKQTSADYFLTALRFLETSSLESWNASMAKDSTCRFTELEWRHFKDFVTSQSDYLRKYQPNRFPVASVTGYLVSQPCYAAGMSTGWMIGKMASESAVGLPVQVALSSGLCWVGGKVAGWGIMIFAPRLAKQLFENAGGISMATLMGGLMGSIGYGVGYAGGLSVDLLWIAFQNACSYIANFGDNSPYEKLSGFTSDGKRILNGIEVQFVEQEKEIAAAVDESHSFQVACKVVDSGFVIKLNDEEVFIPRDFNQFPHKEAIARFLEQKCLPAEPALGLFDDVVEFDPGSVPVPECERGLFSQEPFQVQDGIVMGQPVYTPQTPQAAYMAEAIIAEGLTDEDLDIPEELIPEHLRQLPKPIYLARLKEFLKTQTFFEGSWKKKPPELEETAPAVSVGPG
ncbi:hypothetical protein [Legionella genomosp. 1]|uniref:hypothetical protein n=1 Tax=Legionella genomosp. 1 TaxID=1093625 RepID=UPI0013EFB049|nr:hypothetical protein [Legionella genomosp. 1]